MRKKKADLPKEKEHGAMNPEDSAVLFVFETYEDFVRETVSNWSNLARAVDYINSVQGGEQNDTKDSLKAKQTIARELLEGLETIEFYFSLMAGIPIVSDEESPKMLQLNID